jgi:dihydrofolate reductase
MINGVVAVEKSRGIGLNGQLPWPRIEEDMRFFRALTLGHVVVMGSATWKSLGKPLAGRINVVLSNTTDYSGDQAADHTFSNIGTALAFCQNEYPGKEIFIIGGESIYNQCMHQIQRFFVTELEVDYQSDKFFNLDYVKNNFSRHNQLIRFDSPVPMTITEYL